MSTRSGSTLRLHTVVLPQGPLTMTERLLSWSALGCLALGVFLSACDASIPEEDSLPLESVLQPAQGGGLDGGVGSTMATGTTCGRSSDFDPSCAPSPAGVTQDVVYSWTAPASDRYTFTTVGSTFDTVLELRSASAPAQVLACTDDDPVTYALQAALEVDLVRGQQVLVVVDSYGTGCGNYTLGISAQCAGCDAPPGSCHQPAGTCVNGTCAYSLRPYGSACIADNGCATGGTCNSNGLCVIPPGSCVVHPVDTSGDGLVTICLSGRDHGHCDYPVLDGLTVKIPLKGSVTFPFRVTRILSERTYAMLVEQSGGPRKMTFASFANWLKINPDDPRQVLWDVPESHGAFTGPLFGHHETVSMSISLDVELARTGYQYPIRSTARPPVAHPLQLSYQ